MLQQKPCFSKSPASAKALLQQSPASAKPYFSKFSKNHASAAQNYALDYFMGE